MDIVRDGVRLLVGILGAIGWLLRTVWFGMSAFWRVGQFVRRLSWLTAEQRICSRGHRVAMYGLYDCSCGAVHEGWVFGRCEICGTSCGWTPCPTCGLPIRNPLL